jgi:hypothetical protein
MPTVMKIDALKATIEKEAGVSRTE